MRRQVSRTRHRRLKRTEFSCEYKVEPDKSHVEHHVCNLSPPPPQISDWPRTPGACKRVGNLRYISAKDGSVSRVRRSEQSGPTGIASSFFLRNKNAATVPLPKHCYSSKPSVS